MNIKNNLQPATTTHRVAKSCLAPATDVSQLQLEGPGFVDGRWVPDPDPTLGECWGSYPPRKEHDIAPSTNRKNHLTNLPVGGGMVILRMALHLGLSSCHPVHGPARLKIMSTSSQVRHPSRGMCQVCQWKQTLEGVLGYKYQVGQNKEKHVFLKQSAYPLIWGILSLT